MKRLTLTTAGAQTTQVRSWAYNAIDCIATRRISDVLLPKITDQPAETFTYGFERAAQSPAFAMSMRGTLVDSFALGKALGEARKDEKAAIAAVQANEIVQEKWDGQEKDTGSCDTSGRKDGKHKWPRGVDDTDPEKKCETCGAPRYKPAALNPNSDTQVKHLLYDILKAPKFFNREGNLSVDDESLEKIGAKRPKLYALTELIRECGVTQKARSSLEFKLSPDSRFHSSFSVGTAWTGRWTSSADAFHIGGNGQNITEKFRYPFIADPGMELCYMDVKSAESNVVAHIAGDEGYIEAHRSDTHTYVARLTWPELPWTWESIKDDRKIATSLYPEWDNVPGHDYRFQAKAVQHGTNLGLTAYGLARLKHITLDAANDCQSRYFAAFPGIKALMGYRQEQVLDMRPIYSPLGTRVKLYGRPKDGHTLKQALAFPPQRTVADVINIAAWRIGRELEPRGLHLLKQVHDAILFQFPRGQYEFVKRAMELALIPLTITDYKGITRTVTLGVEASVGLNWGKHDEVDNPDGLVEWEA